MLCELEGQFAGRLPRPGCRGILSQDERAQIANTHAELATQHGIVWVDIPF